MKKAINRESGTLDVLRWAARRTLAYTLPNSTLNSLARNQSLRPRGEKLLPSGRRAFTQLQKPLLRLRPIPAGGIKHGLELQS